MKILDNREQLLKMMPFRPDIFYYFQVMSRKKDNPGQSRDIQLLSKCITSEDALNLYMPEIEALCKEFGARCYVSIWPRSIEKFTKEMNVRLASRVKNGSYSFKVFREFDSISLSRDIIQWKGIIPKSICMLDVDTLDGEDLRSLEEYLKAGGIEIVDIVPSVSGKHYICSNFYPLKFGAKKVDNAEIWEFDHDGRTFTMCRDMNLIFYACLKELE